MKVLILALWLWGCPAGIPDHAIVVPSLEVCEQMGPAVTEEIRRMGEGGAEFACLFQEEPPSDIEACFP